MTRRQSKAIRQQVKAALIQIGLGACAGFIIGAVLFMNL
jgi:presenilin-like A22 family membrane protease